MEPLIFDVDRFKAVNDTYGHQEGDRVVQDIFRLVKGNVRRADLLGRYGGEEFVVLSPGANGAGAGELAEKLRRLVERHDFGKPGKITVSCGIATLLDSDSAKSLFQRADAALYRPKNLGRNRSEIA